MMDDEDVKPREEDTSFAAELGRTFSGFVTIAIIFAIAGGLLWLISN